MIHLLGLDAHVIGASVFEELYPVLLLLQFVNAGRCWLKKGDLGRNALLVKRRLR